MEKKKIGLIGALLMGIGCIVGSGIFGSLPTVANEYGAGVVWALVGAAFVVVLRALSMPYTAAPLPVSGAQFMWDVKLIHPLLAPFISFSTLLMPTMVSLFGVLFAMYVQPLFPNTEINSTLAAVGLLVVFTVVAWFGNRTAINAGNIMVALLLIAIFLYIVLGHVEVDKAVVSLLKDGERPKAPGMKYRHYAPKAPVTVVTGDPEASARYIQTHLPEGAGVICFTEYKELFPGSSIHNLGPAADKAEQARRVFDALREFDHEAVTEIYAQCPDTAGLGLAVANRLKKAAGFHVIEV